MAPACWPRPRRQGGPPLGARPSVGATTQAAESAAPEGPGTVGLAEGDPDSVRAYDDAVARGVAPAPKGPKPILWSGTRRRRRRRPDGAAGRGGGRAGTAAAADPWRTHPFGSAPTAPTPEDAWKWEGVPPGRSLIGKVEAGQLRYYMGDDGHGPAHRVAAAGVAAGRGPGESGDAGRGVTGDGATRYRFGPRERGGALAGWRAGQILTRGGRPGLRRAGAALGAQRGGRGGGHRHPRPLRRAGDGARVGPHG